MELIPSRDPRSAPLNFSWSRVRGVPLAGEALGFVALLCEQSHTEFVSGVMVRFVTNPYTDSIERGRAAVIRSKERRR